MRFLNCWKIAAPGSILLLLAGCSSVPMKSPIPPVPEAVPGQPAPAASLPRQASALPVLPPAGSGRGGYYQDDGPGDKPPEGLQETPDAEPKVEPYSTRANRPYAVFGKTYTPITDNRPLKQRGVGSWYGKKFHGQKTSSGEPYDMYKMTAAHPTLPIPSFARVTNLRTGAQVIVRVNDRGPFHSSRIIDLSYTAALKLGYLGKGSSELEVEHLLPDEIERIASNRQNRSGRPPEPAAVVSAPVVSPVVAEIRQSEPAPVPPVNSAELNEILAVFSESGERKPEVLTAVNANSSGFYIQLGAYGQVANADSVRARILQRWAAMLPSIEVAQSGGLYRLYSGPFASRAEAINAAQKLQDDTLKPLVVQR